MKAKLLLRAFLIWLIIIGVETVHGILRSLLLVPVLGDFPARQVSVFPITEDYDLTQGGMMGFGLLFMAATPILVTMLRCRNDEGTRR